MTALRIPLRVVFYREGDFWIAHCLEFDLVGHGETREEAIGCLSHAIYIQIVASAKHKNPANLFTPADGRFFRMFAAGKDVAIGKVEIEPVDNVTVEGMSTREYEDSDAEACMA
jgi:predicted RNase H-like HicB family nuclease